MTLFAADSAGYGICETQQTTYTKDGDVLFAAMVGSPVQDFDVLPPFLSLDKKILRAGRYADFTHRGTFANLFKTYQYIYGTWLPASREELDDREERLSAQRLLQSAVSARQGLTSFRIAENPFPSR